MGGEDRLETLTPCGVLIALQPSLPGSPPESSGSRIPGDFWVPEEFLRNPHSQEFPGKSWSGSLQRSTGLHSAHCAPFDQVVIVDLG